jgi:hypothetical protein
MPRYRPAVVLAKAGTRNLNAYRSFTTDGSPFRGDHSMFAEPQLGRTPLDFQTHCEVDHTR